jgi:hypothetical protein
MSFHRNEDAPPYNPSLWQNDRAFIVQLAQQRAAQKKSADAQRERAKQQPNSASAAAPPQAAQQHQQQHVNHTQRVSISTRTLWDKLRNFLFPHVESVSLVDAITQASTEDLSMRLQAALAAGDGDQARIVTSELARRRVHLRTGAVYEPAAAAAAAAPVSNFHHTHARYGLPFSTATDHFGSEAPVVGHATQTGAYPAPAGRMSARYRDTPVF